METIRDDANNVIGKNIRRLRLEKQIGQLELVTKVQLLGASLTRETLVKIEGGRQHIKLTQLRAIKEALKVSYEELLS